MFPTINIQLSAVRLNDIAHAAHTEAVIYLVILGSLWEPVYYLRRNFAIVFNAYAYHISAGGYIERNNALFLGCALYRLYGVVERVTHQRI